MHTLQSEPIPFDNSDECHQTIVDTFDSTIDLISKNCDPALMSRITTHINGYAHGIFSMMESEGKSSDVIIQLTVERPVISKRDNGESAIACFVGMYYAPREEMEDGAETDATFAYSFALVLDPETRRIVDCLGSDMRTFPSVSKTKH